MVIILEDSFFHLLSIIFEKLLTIYVFLLILS